MNLSEKGLSFAVAAKYINDLMGDHILDRLTGGLEVLPGIKMIRMFRKVLTDNRGHGQTDIGVDVDLADSAAGCLTELLFRNADSTGHVSAVLVDLGNEFLRHGRRTVEHDREAGQLLGALFEHVEPELGLGAGLELVGAVAGADGDGQGIAAGAGREVNDFFRMRVHGFVSFDRNFVFYTGQRAELSFDHNAVIMSILNNLAGQGDVFFIGPGGGVDHNGGETAVNAALAELEAVAMVQMQRDRDIGVFDHGSLNQLDQIGVVGIGAGTLGNLQDNGSFQFACSFGDTLDDLHVVDVESADSITAVIGLLKHFSGCYEWHGKEPSFVFDKRIITQER